MGKSTQELEVKSINELFNYMFNNRDIDDLNNDNQLRNILRSRR